MITHESAVPQYDIFELALPGPAGGDPFVDVSLTARFEQAEQTVEAAGFYDGEGTYRIRFMPNRPGEWRYRIHSDHGELEGITGSLTCGPARRGVHGPVRVSNQYHFCYDDGTPYVPIGTTCYAWTHQGEALEQQTLETLRGAPFNKLRMCLFPKHYRYNANEPEYYPFDRRPEGGWDTTRPDPAYWRHLEQRLADLSELGVQADLILFHPYDRWGFANLGSAADDAYLRYAIARLAAFHNVWWSLANEYDLLKNKTMDDWDHAFQIVAQQDPYGHLRSVHNWQPQVRHDWDTFYDHRKPWVTHCSVQHNFVDLIARWREQYGRPVIVDECCYEGSIPNAWGNISAQEMVRRFWEGTVRGGYVGHGETYLHPDDILWWSKGGKLYGDSPPRIAFLREILEGLPTGGLDPQPGICEGFGATAGQAGQCYLVYFGYRQPGLANLSLPSDTEFNVELIDTWNTTRQPLGSVRDKATLPLPAQPFHALLLTR